MKTPNIDIKEVLAKVSLLRNNLSVLVPVLIAVVGLLLVIPTRLLSARLSRTVEEKSVAAGKDIDRVTKDLNAERLKGLSQKSVDARVQDANAIQQMVEQAMKRELLTYRLFPDTNDLARGLFEEFAKRYYKGVESMIQSVKAGAPPMSDEITDQLAKVALATDTTGRMGYAPPSYVTGAVRGMGNLSLDNLTDTQRMVVDELCLGKAKRSKVYASLTDVSGYKFWNAWTFENRDKAYRDCWYWQLGYWITEDVMSTIEQMNHTATNVLDAPVKRLVNLSFSFRRAGAGGLQSSSGAGDPPVYVTGVGKGLAAPCTGRFCNASADVVHFEVQVVLDAAQVMPFMQALCSAKEHRFCGVLGNEPEQKYQHNQITILEGSVLPIEPARDATHQLYRYGGRPVVSLDAICEYAFFNTPQFTFIKPKQAKEDLGVNAAASASTPGTVLTPTP